MKKMTTNINKINRPIRKIMWLYMDSAKQNYLAQHSSRLVKNKASIHRDELKAIKTDLLKIYNKYTALK